MLFRSLVTGGWRAPEVREALELCLSCKGCSRDCPTGTDMAAYKSRVLFEAYRGRLRPMNHYALGLLPRWGRLVQSVPGLPALANAVLQGPLSGLVKRVAGLDAARKGMPRFARGSNRRKVAADLATKDATGKPVLLWVDSFSDAFESDAVAAMAAVLIEAGYAPRMAERKACCGLTWISTGQLDGARREIVGALDVLHPYVAQGIPIVGTEPSCLTVWRSDALDLVDDPRVSAVAKGSFTLAELLVRDPDFTMPSLAGHTVVAQPHCHQASVIGWDAEAALLRRSGATVVRLGGCCGLAGNFGMQAGHYETSVKVAQNELLPAIDAAGPDAILLADGFSCRTQINDLASRHALTLAELILTHSPAE